MAEKIYLGGYNGYETDFEQAGNWSPSGIPGTGVNLIFDNRAGIDPDTGKRWSCLSGLDQSAKNFPRILYSSNYDGDVGIGYDIPTAGESALECGCDAIGFRSSGSVYMTAKHASALFDSIVCDSPAGALYIGKAVTSGQPTTSLINVQGQVQFLEAIASHLATSELHSLKQLQSNAVTIVTGGGYNDIDIEIINGQLYLDSGFNSLMMVAGTMDWGNDGFVPASQLIGGAGGVAIYGGAFNWKMWSWLKALKLWAGMVTASGAQAKKLGLASLNSGTIEVWNGTLDLKSAQEGDMVLDTDCEVKMMSAAAAFLPPKVVDITW